jgi:uncharacterized protein (DUF488 family)
VRSVLTIGYEGADIRDFIYTLKQAKVNVVLDVREIAVSRRRGFSKRALSAELALAGVGYQHEKALGSPKPIRDRLREDRDYKVYFRAYDRYLLSQRSLLEELVATVRGNVALLCYERDPRTCHRMSVARELAQLIGRKPRHLGVVKRVEQDSGKSPHLHLGEGLSPA